MSDSFSGPRRKFLHSAGFLAGGMLLSGCLRRIPTWLPPADPDVPLTVDIHCHFFNGTDLQIERFLKYVQDAKGDHPGEALAASAVQDLNWLLAPSGKTEMKKLKANAKQVTDAQGYRDWEKSRAASRQKYNQQAIKADAPSSLQTETAAHPDKNNERTAARMNLAGGTGPAFEEYFQYRYVALSDYLSLYNQGSGRTMDLLIAHLVDYDWPLNDGQKPRTPLDDQVKLMERISVLSNGRVHTFAPFDPFREIAYQARFPNAKWSALDALQSWVAEHGCIGVKLYPPMGFAPYGNSHIDPDFWKGRWAWLCDVKNVPDGKGGHATIGERLDDVLKQLYSWCLKNDVPVMAHTDLSNGFRGTAQCAVNSPPASDFNTLPSAQYWEALRADFGQLRVNFGHMGGLEDTVETDWRAPYPATKINARDLVALMSSDPSAPGGRFFADSAYHENVLSHADGLRKVYQAALAWKTPEQPQPVLPDRIMYGTDWSLLMLEKDMQGYFSDFIRMYAQLDQSLPPGSRGTVSQRFFGENAVDYLGLRDGSTRQRLTAFYTSHGMTFGGLGQPAWMRKIKA